MSVINAMCTYYKWRGEGVGGRRNVITGKTRASVMGGTFKLNIHVANTNCTHTHTFRKPKQFDRVA